MNKALFQISRYSYVRTILLAPLPFVFIFLYTLSPPLDLDLGWHLKYGQHYIQQQSLLQENTFSTEMAGYPYDNHSWGSDILLYFVYQHAGFLGVSVLGAVIMTLTFYFLARAARLTIWQEAWLFPPLIYLLNDVTLQSYRSQHLSFLGISLVLYLIASYERGMRRMLLLSIPLMAVWANLHGQFIMGLALLGLWAFCRVIGQLWFRRSEGQSIFQSDLLFICGVFAAASAATLLTPYGFELYVEIGRHFGNPMQRFIAEWRPIAEFKHLWLGWLGWSVIIAVSLAVGFTKEKLKNYAWLIIAVAFCCFAAWDQRRYYWPMLLLSLPLVAALPERFHPRRPAILLGSTTILLLSVYLYTALVRLPEQRLFSYDWDVFCRYHACSPRSADFLQPRLAGSRLLTNYDWGGWLIWNYPGIKPAIDGRMPFWRDDQGYSAYERYLALESGNADIDQSPYNMVYWPPYKETLFNRLLQLVEEKKWTVIYSDPFSAIFVRRQY